MAFVLLISPLHVDAHVISSAYFALTVKECSMSHCGKGLHQDLQHTCDPIIGLVFHVRVEVDENSSVLFPVVGVMTAPWQGRT